MTLPSNSFIPRPHRQRAKSFSKLDFVEASTRLSDLLRDEGVYFGGASVGKGLKHAARYHLHQRVIPPDFYNLPGAKDLEPNVDKAPLEDSFYVVDIGVLVSQVYQWRLLFPRVEPFCKSVPSGKSRKGENLFKLSLAKALQGKKPPLMSISAAFFQ